jgi:hypothetical protein
MRSICFVTAVAVVVAVGLPVGIASHREQAARRELERLGGRTEVAPEWVRTLGGDRIATLFCRVRLVDVHETAFADADTVLLLRLQHLRSLNLRGCQVSDACIDSLASLPELESLELAGTSITDAGVASLVRLTGLQDLSLSDTRLSDIGLERLHKLKSLNTVWVYRTRVTDSGVIKLRRAIPGLIVYFDNDPAA